MINHPKGKIDPCYLTMLVIQAQNLDNPRRSIIFNTNTPGTYERRWKGTDLMNFVFVSKLHMHKCTKHSSEKKPVVSNYRSQ